MFGLLSEDAERKGIAAGGGGCDDCCPAGLMNCLEKNLLAEMKEVITPHYSFDFASC
jgi:hypothetical protein